MRRLLLIACSIFCLRAEIIDRLAITAGKQAITQLELDEELRVTAFLNRQPISRGLAARRAAADRLIEQLLVRREMELSHYPLPTPEEIDNYLTQVRSEFGAQSFNHALAQYALTEITVREHLALQLTTLRFIEYRFRPALGISDADIQSYYRHEVSTWRTTHTGTAPALETLRDSIRKTLIEQRTDQALDTWLTETRKQMNIVYVDKTLQ